MDEKGVISDIKKQLENDFTFERHVKGKHFSGKELQIDFIIKPKDLSIWKNKSICFGLEFKDMPNLDQKGDTTDFTKWFAQCVDYSNTNWNNYGYIFILTCPGITSSKFVQAVDSSWMLKRIMGHLGIGELVFLKNYGWSIILHDEKHRLWSQKNGVETGGKTWNLTRIFGTR